MTPALRKAPRPETAPLHPIAEALSRRLTATERLELRTEDARWLTTVLDDCPRAELRHAVESVARLAFAVDRRGVAKTAEGILAIAARLAPSIRLTRAAGGSAREAERVERATLGFRAFTGATAVPLRAAPMRARGEVRQRPLLHGPIRP